LAELYCLPPPSDERDALAQSIAKDGKIYEPATLYEGLALDGWIRIQVAKERGIECWAIHFEETKEGIAAQGDKDALDLAARRYLFNKNVVRRSTRRYRCPVDDHESRGPHGPGTFRSAAGS